MTPRTQRLLDAQTQTAQTINRLMLTLLALGLASALTLGLPDSYLLTTTQTVSMPFAGAASFKVLLVVGPVVVIAVRVYLEIYVAHWRRLDDLLRRSPSVQVKRLPVVSPFRHPLLRWYAAFVLYPLVPLILGIFTYEATVFRPWGIAPAFHHVCKRIDPLLREALVVLALHCHRTSAGHFDHRCHCGARQ